MAGGGDRRFSRSPSEIAKEVRQSQDRLVSETFQSNLGSLIGDQLAAYNSRDVALVRERLDLLKERLTGVLEESVDQLFGGSVAKKTYVDGLSDIDSLLIINDTSLASKPPSDVLDRLIGILSGNVSDAASVSRGRMAVTVQYSDGMEVQLLPALRTDAGLKVPSSRTEGWSHIKPDGFQKALSHANSDCGGKLVPVIKLAKALNAKLPEALRLSGYHMESLGIAAFKGYTGPRVASEMLPTYFEKAAQLVHAPIRDSTGQSVHVDEYLGAAGSPDRMARSHVLDRLAKRMRNATTGESLEQWRAILGAGL
ncbi:hypothetical protein ASF31_05540 [Brevundimonas sp. Leaf280]|uniref:CBASS oligonucleotide cyclase n=1 Tax=Brevundimonas sp. Leaf280 TaxID=1736320 RepID=UPI0006F5A973|nr:CBASS oligonucleotide cyclase [Brevundimonas sp. Leaf280]KQP46671.1 hypothetical protein ASF31_05540 [Brevundimonas sp. Leaf280]